MFCPKCKYEYRPGYTECGRCEVPLVKELPTPPKLVYTDLVKIGTVNNIIEAQLLENMFINEGINCHIAGYHHRSLLGNMHAFIEMHVMVAKDQTKKAMDLVEIFRESSDKVPDHKEAINNSETVDQETQIGRSWRLRKNHRGIGFILPFFLPGLGSYYAGKPNFGLVFVILSIISLFTFMIAGIDETSRTPILSLVTFLILLLLDILLTFVFLTSNKKSNRNHTK